MRVGPVERRKRLLREREGTKRSWPDFKWSWSGTSGCERKDFAGQGKRRI